MLLLIIILIVCIITLIACVFGLKEWIERVNNWNTLKQANNEYFDCLMLGLISGLGICICGFGITLIICSFILIV